MSSVHNSVETVNAAATAIVTAESRVQPSAVEKRRWGSCWSIYWCFGANKHQSKRIGHAVLVSDPTPPGGAVAPIAENRTHSSTIVSLPFIAPPSSPASFLPSDPPSVTHSPAGGLLSLSHSHSPGGIQPIFTIGPYAHETQLVSPPVFSTFTTEPSTASFTPPPEPVQMTTPSSPEVPFAELLSSSLARSRRDGGSHLKYPLSQYEFQPYQYREISSSGTSSPFPDNRRPIVEFPKFVGYEHFPNYKWGSRVGSGSLTPSNSGLSRLGSGTMTPNDGNLIENQISEVASLANSDHKSQNDDVVVDHRVSFELFGEDIPTCVVREPDSSHLHMPVLKEEIAEGMNKKDLTTDNNADSFREYCKGESVNEDPGMALDGEGDELQQKHRTISLGSSKDFNFNNAKGEIPEKPSIDCEWWTNEKAVKKEIGPRNSWSFFPMLQSEAT